MNKLIMTALAAGFSVMAANADITVNFKQAPAETNVPVTHIQIADMSKSRAERRAATVFDTIPLQNNTIVIPSPTAPSQYRVDLGDDFIGFFAAPGENIVIDVKSITPFEFTMKGTELIDGMQQLENLTAPIQAKIADARKQNDKEAVQALYNEFQKAFTDFVAANPNSTAVPYAIMNMDGEDLIQAMDNISEAAKASIVMPMAEAAYNSAKKRLEFEQKQQALQSGDVDAPGFTLKNQDGKDVSLSDFKGKWVILDFWGTWCPWCIKGFPALKEAYKKYAGKLEVIGVDCGDTEQVWKEGIVKHDLPWVHVYNPKDSKLTDEYFVQGYPTKVIINPEGKVANITVGENPSFFDTLAKLIGE